MHKPFHTLYGRLGAALLLLTIAFIVHSCRKEAKLTQEQMNAEIAAAHFPVADAKAWFTSNKTALATKVKINSDASVLNLLADFTPVWDSARTAVDTNYYVVEAPARYLNKLGFNTDSTTANINGLTRLLVLKSKIYGSTSAVLMHIHGDNGADIAHAHYMDLPKNFSGNIFYTSLQGAFICGYIYKTGKIIKSNKGDGTNTKPKGPQILQLYDPGDCETITTNYYSQTCFWTGNDELIGCTGWRYRYTTVEIYCDDEGGGGGGPPPPPPPQPDCPQGTHAADDGGNACDIGSGGGYNNYSIKSLNGKLVVRFDYGTSCRCVPDSAATIKNNVKDSCLKAMVQAAIDRNIEYKVGVTMQGIFNNNTLFNLTYTDGSLNPQDDGITTSTYHNASDNMGRTYVHDINVQTELNSSTLPNTTQEYITATILHESLHAYFQATGQLDDHNEMVNHYIPWFEAALHAIYPLIPSDDLEALAYGGLMNSQAFTTSEKSAFASLYNTKNGWYISGARGAKCH